MGLYDGIKDAISIAQKADNIELYKQLLDIGNEALEMQKQLTSIQEENKKLKEQINKEIQIERHKEGLFVTLNDDESKIHYCSTCWGNDKKLIQLNEKDECWMCNKRWISAYKGGNGQ